MIDLSADFRLKNSKIYNKYYGIKHISLNNLKNSVYGLSEINKKNLSKAKIIACNASGPIVLAQGKFMHENYNKKRLGPNILAQSM